MTVAWSESYERVGTEDERVEAFKRFKDDAGGVIFCFNPPERRAGRSTVASVELTESDLHRLLMGQPLRDTLGRKLAAARDDLKKASAG